jgi:hypothetical protein
MLCNYLRNNYPNVIFTSDLSGVRLPMGLARKVKNLKSTRGIPDLIVFQPMNGFHGLLLEIKAPDVQLYRKDGTGMLRDPHREEQTAVILQLRALGYAAYFVRGFPAGRSCIENYMRLPSPRHGDALRSTPCEENHPLEWCG